jgi:RimJ/RimL family protein N-acetyltransferase
MEMDPFKTRQIRFMIDLCKDPGTPVGTIDLFDFDPHHMRAGIGILVASTTQRRRGYASDALNTLLSYCRGRTDAASSLLPHPGQQPGQPKTLWWLRICAERHASAMGPHSSGLGRPTYYAVDSSSMS